MPQIKLRLKEGFRQRFWDQLEMSKWCPKYNCNQSSQSSSTTVYYSLFLSKEIAEEITPWILSSTRVGVKTIQS